MWLAGGLAGQLHGGSLSMLRMSSDHSGNSHGPGEVDLLVANIGGGGQDAEDGLDGVLAAGGRGEVLLLPDGVDCGRAAGDIRWLAHWRASRARPDQLSSRNSER